MQKNLKSFYIKDIKVECFGWFTKIYDSYKVRSKKDMRIILEQYRDNNNNKAINRRSIDDMIVEWRAHNLLYDLHYERSRTKDVDFYLDDSKFKRICYKILSFLYIGLNF